VSPPTVYVGSYLHLLCPLLTSRIPCLSIAGQIVAFATVCETSRGKASYILPVLVNLLLGLRMTSGLSQSMARLPSLYSLILTFCSSAPGFCLGLPSDSRSPWTPLSIANTSCHFGVFEICTHLHEAMPDTPNISVRCTSIHHT
jgi:hypothetical protein